MEVLVLLVWLLSILIHATAPVAISTSFNTEKAELVRKEIEEEWRASITAVFATFIFGCLIPYDREVYTILFIAAGTTNLFMLEAYSRAIAFHLPIEDKPKK